MAIKALDRRNYDRFAYVCRQLVADYDGVNFPPRSEFYKVNLQNIASTGIAFLSPKKPKTDHILVLLGREPICFVARVVRTFYRADSSDLFEVGCEFTLRVAEPKGSARASSRLGHSLRPQDIDEVIKTQLELCSLPWRSVNEASSSQE
jgi:hypothetical protein